MSKARLGRTSDGGASAFTAGQVVGPAAKIPLKPPHPRHNLNSIRPKHPAKPRNTVVLPGTDVQGDLADIAAGGATWNSGADQYEVNGRAYKVERTGTVFPVSGDGLVNLSRQEYKVLQQLIGTGGDVSVAQEAMRRDPGITAAHWTAALEVFRHHKSYRGGA